MTRPLEPVPALQSRRSWQVATAVGLVCTAAATAVSGLAGLWAGLAGTGVVVAFFVAGLMPVTRSRALDGRTGVGLVLLLLGYAARLVLALVALSLLVALVDVDRRALGLTVIACALAWVLASAAIGLRHHDPLDVPAHVASEPPSG